MSHPDRQKYLGARFGKLVVIGEGEGNKLLCYCECATEKLISLSNLLSGKSNSCGCMVRKSTIKRCTKHGHKSRKSPSGIYISWERMIQRCENTHDKNYDLYGGRGITVYSEWRKDFTNFLQDMGPTWREGLTLDRINSNGNYEPFNCRWATQKQQCRNSSRNRLLYFNGKSQCLAQWAEELNIPYKTLSGRMNRHKWTVDRALTQPVRVWL